MEFNILKLDIISLFMENPIKKEEFLNKLEFNIFKISNKSYFENIKLIDVKNIKKNFTIKFDTFNNKEDFYEYENFFNKFNKFEKYFGLIENLIPPFSLYNLCKISEFINFSKDNIYITEYKNRNKKNIFNDFKEKAFQYDYFDIVNDFLINDNVKEKKFKYKNNLQTVGNYFSDNNVIKIFKFIFDKR